ncbi:hypothetical protein [Borrelia persica]|uniref:hypothetical protein n=1 Tax=Borrelia persica TaxID=44448 RepID=UPI0004646C20|nr:hypothetical protein [Borrelia persica]
MKNMKKIKFPKKKKLKASDMDIDEFIAQVDYTTMQLDREFKAFQRQYGEDKNLDDWMVHMERENQIKSQQIQEKTDGLSSRFARKLSRAIKKD